MHAVCYLTEKIRAGAHIKSKNSKSLPPNTSVLGEIVEFTQRPLGITFRIDKQSVIIKEVSKNSQGSLLGLSPDDKLMKINNDTVLDISAEISVHLFNIMKVPFKATFQKSENKKAKMNSITSPKLPITSPSHSMHKHFAVGSLDLSISLSITDIINDNDKSESVYTMTPQYSVSENVITPFSDYSEHFTKKFISNDCQNVFNQYLLSEIECDMDSPPVTGLFLSKSSTSCRLKMGPNWSVPLNEKVNVSQTFDEMTVAIMAETGWNSGIHEWSFKILQCGIFKQEFGVVSNCNKNIKLDDSGIKCTDGFGAKAFFGSELSETSMYYASYNCDGKERCFRDLSKTKGMYVGLCTGNIIKIRLDLQKWKIDFFLNNKQIRKSISLQPGQTYSPIFLFSGHCKYELRSFN